MLNAQARKVQAGAVHMTTLPTIVGMALIASKEIMIAREMQRSRIIIGFIRLICFLFLGDFLFRPERGEYNRESQAMQRA